MREKGRVVGIEGRHALVQMTRSEACSSCGLCRGLAPGSDELVVRATNTAGAATGDIVEMEMETGGALTAAFLVYGAPLIAGIAGYALGSLAGGIYRIIGALAGFILTYPVIHMIDKRVEGQPRFTPEVVGIERREE